jgi:hypothetical protein
MASLVVVMANMPRRKANASGGDIVYVKGSMIASAAAEVRHGVGTDYRPGMCRH